MLHVTLEPGKWLVIIAIALALSFVVIREHRRISQEAGIDATA